MSAGVSWERPPVEVESHGVGYALFHLLVDECFDGDTSSTAERRIEQGDAIHQRLAGAHAALAYVAADSEFANDVEALLGGIAQWGAVVVRVVR
jgi:hypothetical protein